MPSLPILNWQTVTVLLFTSLCLSITPLSGQNLEDVLATLQVEEDGDILTDDELLLLEEFVRRPIDINKASRKQIEEIPLFTSSDISVILQKRAEVEQFTSQEQILAIPGLSVFAGQLLPLVTTIKTIPPINATLRNRWITKENDVRILTQGRISKSTVSGGFILERDPGEPGLTDFVTGYVSKTFSNGTRLIVGDHQLQTGYGLLFSRSVPPIKGYGTVTGMGRPGKGLRPYRSSIEYWALRGIAVEKSGRFGQWIISATSSPKDATVDSNRVVSISTSGLHQSLSSLEKKHNLQENIVLLSWEQNQVKNSFCGLLLALDRWTFHGSPLNNRPPEAYGSVYGQYKRDYIQFFGEMASYSRIQPSSLGGIIIGDRNLQWISSYRFYPSGFQGPRSQPFREWSSSVLNESGFYQGVSLKLGKHRLFTYGDIYRQTSTEKRSGREIRGFEVANTWSYRWRRGQVSLRWKFEEKSHEEDIVYLGNLFMEKTTRESWRFNSSLSPNKQLRIQIQGDHTAVFNGETSFRGNGVSIKGHLTRNPYRLSINWVGFIADNYLSRIYVWDLNFPGELRNKTFYPTGQSVACLLRLNTKTGATLSARLRTTWKFSKSRDNWLTPDTEMGVQMDIAF